MQPALAEAELAAACGETPVGAAIYDSCGNLLASAGNRVEKACNPCGHAEIIALFHACKKLGSPRLPGCILLVTLEPCLMCAGAIAHSRIAGVVFGAADRVAGSLISTADSPNLPLAGRKFWHLGGICSERCAEILSGFFAAKRNPQPSGDYA